MINKTHFSKIISLLISVFIIIQIILTSSCTQVQDMTTPLLGFSQKAFNNNNDLCSKPEESSLKLDKNSYIIGKNPSDKIIINYNISSKFSKLESLLRNSYGRKVKYTIKIYKEVPYREFESLASFLPGRQILFEKEISPECSSIEWDGKGLEKLQDNNENLKADIFVDYFHPFFSNKAKSFVQFSLLEFYRYILITPLGSENYDLYKKTDPYRSEAYYCDGFLKLSPSPNDNCKTRKEFLAPETMKDTSQTIFLKNENVIPENTEFFEVDEVKQLHDIVSRIKVEDYNANNLYNIYKSLEGYYAQKESLEERLKQENISEDTKKEITDKIDKITKTIVKIEESTNKLKSGILIQLSDLYNKYIVLARHINTTLKNIYIKPYPPEDKPDSVGGYFDKAYFADIDISNLLGENGVTLYAPDTDDPDQANLKETWEVDDKRVEILDPSTVFDGAKYIFDEVQTAKDLATDILEDKFSIEDRAESVQTIQQLVSQIKTHTGLLDTQSKIYQNKYIDNFEKTKEVTAEMHTSLMLPLALAMEQVENYSDETFRLKSTNEDQELRKALRTIINTNEFQIKNETVDALFDYAYAKSVVLKGYFNKPLPYKEKVISIMLGYSKADWEALKKVDPQGTDELMKATEELISAFGVPLTVGDLGLVLITPIIKTVKVLSKISSNVLAKGAPADKAKILKSFQDTIIKAKEKLIYWFGKYFPKGCLEKALYTQSFNSFEIKKAIEPCPIRGFGRFNIANHLWKIKGGVYKIPDAKKYQSKVDSLKKSIDKVSNLPEEGLKDDILKMANNFKTKGAKITPYGHINFSGGGLGASNNYVLKEFNIVGKLKELNYTKDKYISGNRDYDFEAANRILAEIWFGNQNKYKDVKEILSKLQLTWHHHENLTDLQLIPSIVHGSISPHVGSVEYVKVIRLLNKDPIKNANVISNYFTKFISR